MKIIIKFCVVLGFILTVPCLFTFGQVSINTDNSAPDNSAMLDVKSNNKGMLVPRMTAALRDAINNPATGLLIFCTDNNQYYYNTGTPAFPNWVMTSSQWITNGVNIYYNAGNVGIGTDNPQDEFEISTTGIHNPGIAFNNDLGMAADVKFYINENLTSLIRLYHDLNGYPTWDFQQRAPEEKSRLFISGNGCVGIGTDNPKDELDINTTGVNDPGINFNNDIGNAADISYNINQNLKSLIRLYHDPNGATWDFQNRTPDPLSRLYIAGDGNVGIGTTNPMSKLEVAGTIYSTIGGIKFPDGTLQTTATAIPLGVIVMWSGTISNIPSGWALCNGANGTPDLRDKFIYGTSAGENPGETGGYVTHYHIVDPPDSQTNTSSDNTQVATGYEVGCSLTLHSHHVNIPAFSSAPASSLPPFFKLAYIMKL